MVSASKFQQKAGVARSNDLPTPPSAGTSHTSAGQWITSFLPWLVNTFRPEHPSGSLMQLKTISEVNGVKDVVCQKKTLFWNGLMKG
jgi:hypothetical protein